ncbi:MAG: VCBS repeat-containing protein, partial [Deltaproteobacteria bacterium]|nr:VCBS repeat-containing protein [Deltaproteobacteria bacterium]
VLSTPAVGDVDADGSPDVVLLAYTTSSPTYLVVLDGRDGAEKLAVPLSPPGGWSSHVALGNLDADPELEIAISVEGPGIAVFEHDGTRRWTAPLASLTGVSVGAPAIADLDGVPPAEVVFGAVVFSADGAVLDDRGHGGAVNYSTGAISVPVDLEGDTVVEIVGGNRVLRFGGGVVWDRPTETEGYPAVADFFGDGVPDVVVVSRGTVRLMNALTGEVSFGPLAIPGGGNGGPPTVADFDGDGRPEFAAAALGCYAVYDPDCVGPAPDPALCDRSEVELNACLPALTDGVLWSQPNQDDSSSVTGSSVFDFEGDGKAEVVYNDECHLYVYDGGTGRVLLARPNTSRTGTENPVVVDVDGDENAEIVVPANAEARRCDLPLSEVPDSWGMFALGDPAREWVRTRKVWNQHAYYVTNVGDDGSLPVPVRPNWAEPGLNNFRQNVQPDGLFAAPDLVVARVVVNTRLCAASLELVAWITNRGSGGAPAGIPIAFYEGDPATGGTLLGVVPTSDPVLPGASTRVTLAAPVGEARVGETILYFVRVDDDGTGAPSGLTHECRTDNNSFGPTPGVCPFIG